MELLPQLLLVRVPFDYSLFIAGIEAHQKKLCTFGIVWQMGVFLRVFGGDIKILL